MLNVVFLIIETDLFSFSSIEFCVFQDIIYEFFAFSFFFLKLHL